MKKSCIVRKSVDTCIFTWFRNVLTVIANEVIIMRRKCRTCLCRTCLTVCGKCVDCKTKTKFCEDYNGFWQESIFNEPQEPQYQGAPRHSLEYYGLTDERVKELENLIQSGRYTSVARQAAYAANKDIAEYILLSVEQNKSYDTLSVKWELKEMERIPYCRTDFYGVRRYFMSIMDKKMRRIGK